MTLKSYFSSTVEAAMAQAAKELGSEAMLIYSRETPPEARNWGRYEVVFGWEMNAGGDVSSMERAAVRPAARSAEPLRTDAVSAPNVESDSVGDVEAILAEAEFSPALVGPLARMCGHEPSLQSPRPAFWAEVRSVIPVASAEDERKINVVVLAGPAGVGKTSTLAKMAFRIGLARSRPVHLVATDTDRICGGQWLERFAQIAGATFSMADSLIAFENIIRSEPPGRLILSEAGGWLVHGGAGWTALRRRNPSIQVHLLLPVAYRSATLRSLFSRYQPLGPDRIIAARMDESENCGAVCSLAAEHGLPLSYITSGDAIPDALEAASLERLLGPLFARASRGPRTEPKGAWATAGGGE